MAVPIIILFPLLVLFTSREAWYPYFFAIARSWAAIVLYGCGFIPIVKKEVKIDSQKSYMFVANHTSMTDIILMLYCVKNPFVFVGKKELTRIPIFGFFYKRACIVVDRDSQKSKQEVFQKANQRLQGGTSICIFPEGGVSDDLELVLGDFKDGAFRLAIDHQIPVVPLTFLDNKKRFPFFFFKGNPGQMRAYLHRPLSTQGYQQTEKRKLKEITRDLIYSKLTSHTY